VTRTSRRLASTAAAAGLALVVLTGCGNTPVRAGAAATVGDARITTSELQGYVSRGLADPQAEQQLGADRAAYQRQTLGRLINHQVLAEAARRSGVTVTSGEVDAKLAEFQRQAGGAAQLEQQAAQNGIAKQDLPGFISDVVLNQALGDKLTASLDVPAAQLRSLYAQNLAQYDQVHSAHILVPTKAQADAILATVKADPGTFAAQAAQASTDASNKDKGGDLGFAGRGQFVKEFEAAIFAAKPGAFLVVKSQFGFHVVHVIERRTTTLAQATPDLRRAALQQQRDQLTSALLTKVAKDLGVKVNPRFGQWDGTKGSIVPAPVGKDSVSSPAPAPAGGSQEPGLPVAPSPAGQ
jgi:parvulin-like peptidyl-prolyl isomerase